jgi:hypothetical protein
MELNLWYGDEIMPMLQIGNRVVCLVYDQKYAVLYLDTRREDDGIFQNGAKEEPWAYKGEVEVIGDRFSDPIYVKTVGEDA